jgi:hypothetical protein
MWRESEERLERQYRCDHPRRFVQYRQDTTKNETAVRRVSFRCGRCDQRECPGCWKFFRERWAKTMRLRLIEEPSVRWRPLRLWVGFVPAGCWKLVYGRIKAKAGYHYKVEGDDPTRVLVCTTAGAVHDDLDEMDGPAAVKRLTEFIAAQTRFKVSCTKRNKKKGRTGWGHPPYEGPKSNWKNAGKSTARTPLESVDEFATRCGAAVEMLHAESKVAGGDQGSLIWGESRVYRFGKPSLSARQLRWFVHTVQFGWTPYGVEIYDATRLPTDEELERLDDQDLEIVPPRRRRQPGDELDLSDLDNFP